MKVFSIYPFRLHMTDNVQCSHKGHNLTRATTQKLSRVVSAVNAHNYNANYNS